MGIITVDIKSRTLLHDGELLLGVEHDYQAERIQFQFPKQIGDGIDLSSDTVEIYIDFKNAYREPYIYQCTDKAVEGEHVTFSWLLTKNVTVAKGVVEFTVCIKNHVNDLLHNEWHTTPFKGKVLPGIDVSEKGNEIIADDVASTAALRKSVDNLNTQLADTELYIDGRVNAKYVELENKLTNTSTPLVVAKANAATTAERDGNGNVIKDTYLTEDDLVLILQDNVIGYAYKSDLANYLPKTGGTVEHLTIKKSTEEEVVVLDGDLAQYTINGRNIALEPVVEDITHLCQYLYFDMEDVHLGEEDSSLILDTTDLTINAGDKVRVYFSGGDDYPTLFTSVLEVEIVSSRVDGVYGGRNVLFVNATPGNSWDEGDHMTFSFSIDAIHESKSKRTRLYWNRMPIVLSDMLFTNGLFVQVTKVELLRK